MYMKDWIVKLEDYLRLSDRDILTHVGRCRMRKRYRKVELEFEKYRQQQLCPAIRRWKRILRRP